MEHTIIPNPIELIKNWDAKNYELLETVSQNHKHYLSQTYLVISVFLLKTRNLFLHLNQFCRGREIFMLDDSKGGWKGSLQAQIDKDVINYIRIDNNKIFWSRW